MKLHMVPAVQQFVHEVVFTHKIVSEYHGAAEAKDWVRDPIISLEKSVANWPTVIADLTRALATLRHHRDDDEVRAENTELGNLRSCLAAVRTHIRNATEVALQWPKGLDDKMKMVAQHCGAAGRDIASWHNSVSNLQSCMAEASQIQHADSTIISHQQDVAVLKQRYKTLRACAEALPTLRQRGWGGRKGKKLPVTWADWSNTVAELQSNHNCAGT